MGNLLFLSRQFFNSKSSIPILSLHHDENSVYIVSFTDTYQKFACAGSHTSGLELVPVLQPKHEKFIYLEEYCLQSLNI